MLTIVRQENEAVVIRASGKLTHEDYQLLQPQLETIIKEYKKLSMVFDMRELEGWELDALWDDFKLGMKFRHDFYRVAVLGDKTWEKWAAKMADLFMQGEVKFFLSAQESQAWDWVTQKI